MRALHRIRVEGTNAAADRLRAYLHKASFVLVPDSSASYTVTCSDGPQVTLDSVDSLLERRLLANLQELHERFPGCGHVLITRAGGNQDPDAVTITAPAELAEAVALAGLRAIVQSSEQADPVAALMSFAPPAPWWKFW